MYLVAFNDALIRPLIFIYVLGLRRNAFRVMFPYTTFLNEERECSHRCPAFHDSQRLSAVSIETEASESWSLNFNDLWQWGGLMEPWQKQHTPTKTHREHPLITNGEWGWGRRCFTQTSARTRPNHLKGRWHRSHETMMVSGHVEPPRLAELALKANVKLRGSNNIPLNNIRGQKQAWFKEILVLYEANDPLAKQKQCKAKEKQSELL